MTERYYKRYPRDFADPWPCEKYEMDGKLRHFLTEYVGRKPAEICQLSKDELDLDLE